MKKQQGQPASSIQGWDTQVLCTATTPLVLGASPDGARLLRARSHFIPKHYVLRQAAAGSSYTLPQKYGRNKAITQAQTHERRDRVQDQK